MAADPPVTVIDPPLRFRAVVTGGDCGGPTLSQTRFVPETPERQSGIGRLRIDDGQPDADADDARAPDRRLSPGTPIHRVTRNTNGELIHHLSPPWPAPGLLPGQPVIAVVDGIRRNRLNRLHSALHLLYLAYLATHGPARRIAGRVTASGARIELLQPAGTRDRPVDLAAITSWIDTMIAEDLVIRRLQGPDPHRLHWYLDGVGSVACAGLHPRSTGQIGALDVSLLQNDPDRIKLAATLVE